MNNEGANLGKELSINEDKASWKEVDGEIVLLNFETTVYYSLNETGTFVWKKLLEESMPMGEIINLMSTHYSVDRNDIKEDVNDLIQSLLNEKLLIEKVS